MGNNKNVRQIHSLFAAAIKQSSEGIAIANIEGNLLFVNKAFAKVHGYKPGEVIGKHLSIFHTAEQMPAVKEDLKQIKEKGSTTGKIWHVRRDGTVFPALMQNSLLRNKHGKPIGIIGTIHDLTEQKRAKMAIWELERQLRQMLEKVQLAAVMLDTDGSIGFINDFLLTLTGWEKEQVVGKNWFNTFIPPEIRQEIKNIHKDCIAGNLELAAYHENEILTKDKRLRLISWSNTVSRDLDGNIIGTTSIGEDITEKRFAEKKAHQREIELTDFLKRLTLLTKREFEVMKLVADGKLSKQIAFGLGISHKTVEHHREKIMKKLEIDSVAQLAQYLTKAEIAL